MRKVFHKKQKKNELNINNHLTSPISEFSYSSVEYINHFALKQMYQDVFYNKKIKKI